MTTPSLLEAQKLTDRSLIESVVSNFFILDYGFISKVNADKTVNVTHAAKLKTRSGEYLPEMETKNLEVLTIAGKGFSLNFDYAKGDKVLLLGLKTFVKSVEDVTSAQNLQCFAHYDRSTLKALPLCVFNEDAKVTVEIKDGKMKIDTEDKIELNGNSKSFVTYSELNQALQQLLTTLKSHTHSVSTSGGPTAQSGTASASSDLASATLDISAAETKTIKTGG